MYSLRRLRALSVAVTVLSVFGCGDDESDKHNQGTCQEQSCGAQSLPELLSDIEGFSDPFSSYLRANASDTGSLSGDYRGVLSGVGIEQGCDSAKEGSFVVLSNNGFTPRTIFTNCVDEPNRASRFFLLAPIIKEGPDTNPQELHLSAWDEDAGRYRHFATSVDPQGEMRVSTQPGYCLGCHGGTEPLPYWQPLMNEMRNPWSQWNAEPGFSSHLFDEYLVPEFLQAPTFQKMIADVTLHPASEFETLVRSGIARVVGNRIRKRSESPDMESALRLLRPVFCDETVNFVSEIHGGGEISSAIVVDDALRNLMASMRPGAWDFVNEPRFRLPAPSADEERVVLMPIRGESTVAAEASLLPRGVLSAVELLQVRLLDYGHPVASDFRCSLFEQGKTRAMDGAIDDKISALPSTADNSELVGLLYTEFMQSENSKGEMVSLLVSTAEEERFLAIADIESDKAKAFLQGGAPTELVLALDQIGSALQERITQAERSTLLLERELRVCKAQQWFPGTPNIPGLSCQ